MENKPSVAEVIEALKVIKQFCKETARCNNCLQILFEVCDDRSCGDCEWIQEYPPSDWIITDDHYGS